MNDQSALFDAASTVPPPKHWQRPDAVDERKGRHHNPDAPTSIAGAHSVAYRAGSQKQRLLAVYVDAGPSGLTDDEAAVRAGLDRTCFWKRCGELRQDGVIEDTGNVRRGPMFGELRIVSAITENGRSAWVAA